MTDGRHSISVEGKPGLKKIVSSGYSLRDAIGELTKEWLEKRAIAFTSDVASIVIQGDAYRTISMKKSVNITAGGAVEYVVRPICGEPIVSATIEAAVSALRTHVKNELAKLYSNIINTEKAVPAKEEG